MEDYYNTRVIREFMRRTLVQAELRRCAASVMSQETIQANSQTSADLIYAIVEQCVRQLKLPQLLKFLAAAKPLNFEAIQVLFHSPQVIVTVTLEASQENLQIGSWGYDLPIILSGSFSRIRPLNIDEEKGTIQLLICSEVAYELVSLNQLLGRRIISWKIDTLRGASLFQADLRALDLQRTDLRKADLRGALLSEADLSGANLHRADLREAYLSGINLRGAMLSWADLRGAILERANLCEADMYGADLYRADLSRTNLHMANFSGANLCQAILWGAVLREANLREADMRGAILRGSGLLRADLRGANLQGADMRAADLRGARLLILSLEEADRLQIKYDRRTIWPWQRRFKDVQFH